MLQVVVCIRPVSCLKGLWIDNSMGSKNVFTGIRSAATYRNFHIYFIFIEGRNIINIVQKMKKNTGQQSLRIALPSETIEHSVLYC